MFRGLVLAVLLAAPTVSLAQEGDPVTQFENDDAAMVAAQQTAQETLPLFLKHATDAQGYGVASAAVKVSFDVGNNQSEVIWVAPFAWDGDQAMFGLLANQPNFMGDLQSGDRVDFSISMVRDWSLSSEQGQIYGNYTTRVMLPMLDQETAAQLTSALTSNPVPDNWR